MRHQSQKGFMGICVGIVQHKKGYLIYVPSTRKILSSHDVVFEITFSSALSYTPRPFSESLTTRPSLLYIPYAKSSYEKTGDITFAQFHDGNLLGNKQNVVEDE